MKPEQWRLDLYQDLFSFAPYNSDLARAFIAIDHDEIPEEDDQGRRRVEGFKVVFEGVVRKGEQASDSGLFQGWGIERLGVMSMECFHYGFRDIRTKMSWEWD
jgi:hypothetical protein